MKGISKWKKKKQIGSHLTAYSNVNFRKIKDLMIKNYKTFRWQFKKRSFALFKIFLILD